MVSAATVITGGFRYTITRNLDGSGANSWLVGDAVASLGAAVGSGYIDLTATSTIHSHLGPTMTIYSRTSAATWNGVKPVVSVGNLRSFVDYSADKFGIAHGNDLTLTPSTGFSGVTSDDTNGLRLFNTALNLYTGGSLFLKLDTTTGLTIKSGTGTALPTSSIYGAMWYRDSLGGNKAAYIASIYDTTSVPALRGNNLFVTSYDSPAGPSQLNVIALDEALAYTDVAQISMSGGKPTLAMTSKVSVSAETLTLAGGSGNVQVVNAGVTLHPHALVNGTVVAGVFTTSNTNTIYDVMLPTHLTSATPAVGFGVAIRAKLKSNPTANRDAGRIVWKWANATDATRNSEVDISAYYTTTERVGMTIGANATVPLIGFLGAAPVAKPAAYTQTYTTATRTHSNITAVAPAAYVTGAFGYSTAAVAQAVHAAIGALISDVENIKQVLNSVIDDQQLYGLLA